MAVPVVTSLYAHKIYKEARHCAVGSEATYQEACWVAFEEAELRGGDKLQIRFGYT